MELSLCADVLSMLLEMRLLDDLASNIVGESRNGVSDFSSRVTGVASVKRGKSLTRGRNGGCSLSEPFSES